MIDDTFTGMDDLYRDFILDHYRNPRNAGTIEDADASFEDINPLCGDKIRRDLKVEDGKVADVRFAGRGCAISMASASLLTEQIKGLRRAIAGELGFILPPVRIQDNMQLAPDTYCIRI